MKRCIMFLLLVALVSCNRKIPLTKVEVPMFYTTKDCKIILVKVDYINSNKSKVIFLCKHNHKIQ